EFRRVLFRSLFAAVDHVAPEQAFNLRWQVAFLRQLQQQLQSVIGDAVFRVIEAEAGGTEMKALETLRIGGKPVAHVLMANALVMLLQLLPQRRLSQAGSNGHEDFLK